MPTRDWRSLFAWLFQHMRSHGCRLQVEYGRKAETYRNWRKGTTRSGACALIWLNTENYEKLIEGDPDPDTVRIDRWISLSWFYGWPFLVHAMICLVNSVNEQNFNPLNSYIKKNKHQQKLSIFVKTNCSLAKHKTRKIWERPLNDSSHQLLPRKLPINNLYQI